MTRDCSHVPVKASWSPAHSQVSPVEMPHRCTMSRLLREGSDRGASTAEFAIVLPAVVAIIALILVIARTTMVAMACQDAAALIARELVVSDNRPADERLARSSAQRLLGGDAHVDLTYEANSIIVQTGCPVVPDPLGALPRQVEGKAIGILEEGT